MGKIVQSFALYEMRLPSIKRGGRVLPEVVLPRGRYSPAEMDRGKRPVVVLSDAEVERLEADEVAMSMFRPHGRGGKIGFRFVDAVPERYRSKADRITTLEQQNAVLRSLLRKSGIPIPDEGGGTTPSAPTREVAEGKRADSVDLSELDGHGFDPERARA